mgnify:CR=1 FL=1
MNPADLRKYILEAFALNKPLLAIVREVADLQGVGLNPAGQLVVDELGNAGLGGTIDSASLFAAIGEDADIREAQEIGLATGSGSDGSGAASPGTWHKSHFVGPGGTGQGGQGAVSPGVAQGGVDDPFGAFVDPDIARQIAQEEVSFTRGGRGSLFDQFTAQQPGFSQFTENLQRGINRAFDPLSAQFALLRGNPATQGATTPNFRSFLEANPARFDQGQFVNALAPLGAAFGAVDPSLAQQSIQQNFGDIAGQNVLISQAVGSGLGSQLSRFLPGIISQRRDAFDINPADPNEFFRQFLTAAGTAGGLGLGGF